MAKVEGKPCKKCGCDEFYSYAGRPLQCVICTNANASDSQERRAQAAECKREMPKAAYKWGFEWQKGEVNPFSYTKEIQLYYAWMAGFNDAGHTI